MARKTKKQQQPQDQNVFPFSVEAARPQNVMLDIRVADQRVMRVEVEMLTYTRWYEAEAVYPLPPVPKTRWDVDREILLPNPVDPDYLQAKVDMYVNRMCARAVWALEGGGNEIPGDGIQEKVEELRDWDAGVLNRIMSFLRRHVEVTEAQLAALSDNFHGLPGGSDEDSAELEDDGDGLDESA